MSQISCALVRRLILGMLLFTGSGLVADSAAAQVIGSQAANIPFSNQWQVPAGVNELDDYFTAPGYVTLLELWGIN